MARPLPKALLSQDFDSRFIYGLPDAKKSVPLAPSHPTQTNAWIDKLLELNKADVDHKGDKIPTTAGLVDTMKRYDAIFGEIINQTGKYSEKLASLQIKAWGGVMQLLECMVKGSHRYAKQTAHLQEEAKAILSERKTREFSDKRNEEEFNYEKASIRAQLRNAESQAEALVIENRILKREKDALREVIRVYIQSGMEITAEGKAKTPEELSKPQSMPKRSSSKESAVTLQEKHFQTIMALDVDMNTALDEVYHESNNFQGLLSKLSKVLVSSQQPQQNNNKDTISSGKTLSERGLVVSHTAKQLDYQKAALFRNTATQVDEKDVMGALDLSPNAGLVRIHIREALPLIPWEEVAKIPSVPSQLEAFMVYKYSIKRIPSLQWLHQLIYAIYRDRIQYNQLLSLQANEKRDVVYIRPSLSTYVYTIFFQNRFQVSSSIDVQCATLLQAISFHCERSPRVRLFAAMIGLQRAGAYTMDNCDSDFIISIFDAIFNCSQFCIDPRTHIEMIPLAFSYELVETLIGSSSTECASECSKGIRALDTSGPSDSFVSVDEVITVLVRALYNLKEMSTFVLFEGSNG